MSEYPYDPWQKYQTRSGLDADLVISALQKEIRRNHPENAATLAYEMIITCEELEEYLWFRLKTISVEDIGFGEPDAPILIGTLDTMRKTFKQPGDRGLLAMHAVRYLCKCRKDRSSDEMYCWIIKEYKSGRLKPQIPDYAIDKHTLKGQELKKDETYFYETGSKVSPEWEERDKTYRNRVLEIIKANPNAPQNYAYDPWQKCTTLSGIAADLVISAVQKEIRRNHPENAATLAYDMIATSEELEDYLWFRLKTISVEDVGLANEKAAVLVGVLDQMRQTFKQKGDRGLLAIHAVRYLCQSMKDRSSDEMYNWIMKEYKSGKLRPQIPDYAIDKHTLKGQQLGLGEDNFYSTSAVVSPEWEERDKTYRERILKILEDQRNK